MMMKKIFPLLGILVMVAGTAAAQGGKTINEKKIAVKTVNEYFIEEGQDEPVVESIERYNEKGELVELKEMNRKGEIRRWEKYAYDKKATWWKSSSWMSKEGLPRPKRTSSRMA
jgi:hypothetical protein